MAKTKKYLRKQRTPFSNELLPVIQNLMAEGRSLADIGLMIGYAGQSPKSWMSWLKNTHPEVSDALDAGRKMADTKLVVTAFDVATGYDVEEVDIEYINNPVIDSGGVRNKYIEKSRKTKTKHIKPDPTLLFKLMCNRLPEYFNDTKQVEINKRSLDIKANVTAEIEGFAGKLIDMANRRKKIESKEVNPETENELIVQNI